MSDERDERLLELAELYALGGLEPGERAEVEGYLAGEGCRSSLARGRFAAYALAASAAEQPPPALRDRVLAAAKARSAASAPTRLPPPAGARPRPAFWMQPAWLAAAAAVVLIVFAVSWANQWWLTNRYAASCTPAPCTVSGVVVSSPGRTLRLEAHGLSNLSAGKVYQTWYIRQGAPPTPAPTFVPDTNGNATVELPIRAEHGLTIAVTVEPAGGSKAPTTKPFLVASIN